MEGLVNRSGGVRRQVNKRQGVPQCMKRSIFSLPSPRLNGQLDPLRAFLAKERPKEGDDRKSENTSAMLEAIHLPLLLNTLRCLLLYSGNFQTASSPPRSHKTALQSRAPLPSALLFLPRETQLDMTLMGSSSTSLKLLAPSQMHLK